MPRYLIKLKPVDSFFFGGEETFAFSENGEGKASYYEKSNLFPQQTAILGLLRREIIKNEGLLKEDWSYSTSDMEKLASLIGKGSFDFDARFAQDFGKIKSISPVFITNEGSDIREASEIQAYLELPRDHYVKEGKLLKFEFENKSDYNVRSSLGDDVKIIKDFDCKDISQSYFLDNNKKIVPFFREYEIDSVSGEKTSNGVFTKITKVGINKSNQLEKGEKGFFKSDHYTMKGFSFAVVADVEAEIKPSIVTLGTSQSKFHLLPKVVGYTFEELLDTFAEDIFGVREDRKVFISHSFIENSLKENYEFAAIDSIGTRSMATNYKVGNSMRKRYKKSACIRHFVDRGSVLHGNMEKLMKENENSVNLKSIGYNYIR